MTDEPNERVTVVEALAFKLRRAITNTGLADRYASEITEDVKRLVEAIVQESVNTINAPAARETDAIIATQATQIRGQEDVIEEQRARIKDLERYLDCMEVDHQRLRSEVVNTSVR